MLHSFSLETGGKSKRSSTSAEKRTRVERGSTWTLIPPRADKLLVLICRSLDRRGEDNWKKQKGNQNFAEYNIGNEEALPETFSDSPECVYVELGRVWCDDTESDSKLRITPNNGSKFKSSKVQWQKIELFTSPSCPLPPSPSNMCTVSVLLTFSPPFWRHYLFKKQFVTYAQWIMGYFGPGRIHLVEPPLLFCVSPSHSPKTRRVWLGRDSKLSVCLPLARCQLGLAPASLRPLEAA